MSGDSEKPFSIQIECLNKKNYHSRSTQVHAVLHHQKVLDVTVESKAKPNEPEAKASDEDKGDYKAKLEAWEVKAAKANAIPVPMISGRLMMIVENDNDLAKIWSAWCDRFHPTSDVTLAQALRYIVTLRIANDGDMEAHIHDFMAGNWWVEEHGSVLTDIIYRTFFILSMPMAYQIMVTVIEFQSGVTLEVAQNRLLEEWRKCKGQLKGGEILVTAMQSKSCGCVG